MPGLRIISLLVHLATAARFLVGVRRTFVTPDGGRPQWWVAGVAGSVLTTEAVQIARSRSRSPLRFATAMSLHTAALALFEAAARVTRRRRLTLALSPDTPEHLERGGPYGYVRHPFYVSYLLSIVAGWIASASRWLFGGVVLGVATYWYAARFEERKFADSSLREEYDAYARQTGMFLPRTTRRA